MDEVGHEMEPVMAEEAGPMLRCMGCGVKQVVSDGISRAEVDAIFALADEDQDDMADELAVHDVHYCVYDACPRCGNGIDNN
jgi:hypothetical protein